MSNDQRASRSTRPLQRLYPYNFHDNVNKHKYYFDNFKGGASPISWVQGATNSHPVMPLATGGASDGELDQGVTLNSIMPFSGMFWQAYMTTAQTLNPYIPSANGLEIGGDEVENESLEYTPGGNGANSPLAFVSGTDSDFFIRCKFKITDVSGFDQFGIGFRKQEAYAVPTSLLSTGDGVYTDFFLLGINGEDGVNVQTMSDLNNSGSTTVTDTGFNATDAEVLELEVRVIGRKAIGYINGVRLGNPVAKDGDGTAITSQATITTASFTFDSGDTLVPMIFTRHDDEVAEDTFLQEIEIGHLVDRGLDPNAAR